MRHRPGECREEAGIVRSTGGCTEQASNKLRRGTASPTLPNTPLPPHPLPPSPLLPLVRPPPHTPPLPPPPMLTHNCSMPSPNARPSPLPNMALNCSWQSRLWPTLACSQPMKHRRRDAQVGMRRCMLLGELAPDVQQQHLQLGHVVQRERHHGLVLRKVLVCRAGHEQLADGNAVRAHSPAHIALVELHAAALGGLTGAGELCIARCRLPLVCSKAGAACPVRGIALEHGCGGARLGITCTLGRPSCPGPPALAQPLTPRPQPPLALPPGSSLPAREICSFSAICRIRPM